MTGGPFTHYHTVFIEIWNKVGRLLCGVAIVEEQQLCSSLGFWKSGSHCRWLCDHLENSSVERGPSHSDLSPSDVLASQEPSFCKTVGRLLPDSSEDALVCPQLQVLPFHLLVHFLNLFISFFFLLRMPQSFKK